MKFFFRISQFVRLLESEHRVRPVTALLEQREIVILFFSVYVTDNCPVRLNTAASWRLEDKLEESWDEWTDLCL